MLKMAMSSESCMVGVAKGMVEQCSVDSLTQEANKKDNKMQFTMMLPLLQPFIITEYFDANRMSIRIYY